MFLKHHITIMSIITHFFGIITFLFFYCFFFVVVFLMPNCFTGISFSLVRPGQLGSMQLSLLRYVSYDQINIIFYLLKYLPV